MSKARDRYIIHYSTAHLSSTDLVTFFYQLKGRGNNIGFLKETNSKFLARSIIEIPANSLANWKYFFNKWACDYKKVKIVNKSKSTHKLFVFDSSNLVGSKKVTFFYQLKGRGNQRGIIKTTDSRYITKSVILVSVQNYFEIVKFLRDWNCDFIIKEVNVNER